MVSVVEAPDVLASFVVRYISVSIGTKAHAAKRVAIYGAGEAAPACPPLLLEGPTSAGSVCGRQEVALRKSDNGYRGVLCLKICRCC